MYFFTSYFLLLTFQIAQQIIIPTPQVGGRGLTLAEIGNIIAIIGSFLTNIGVLFAIIAVIVSGIMYMKAGAEPTKIDKAKGWFKNALIGALIVIGVGAIINTIANVVSRQFFCTVQIIVPFFQRCLF